MTNLTLGHVGPELNLTMGDCCSGIVIGNCPGRMNWCVYPGAVFEGQYTRFDDLGNTLDWPVGTIAKLVIIWGTGTLLVYPVAVSGPNLVIALSMSDTLAIPRSSMTSLCVDYTGSGTQWRVLLTGGKVSRSC